MGTQPKVHTTLITKCLAAVRRQGTRKGWRQASPQGVARQHPGHHQAGDPPSGSSWWREASRTSSTKRLVVCSRSSLRASSVTPSPTPSTRVARPSPRWTSSTRSSARVAPSTALVVKHLLLHCFSVAVLQRERNERYILKTKPKKINGCFKQPHNVFIFKMIWN